MVTAWIMDMWWLTEDVGPHNELWWLILRLGYSMERLHFIFEKKVAKAAN